MWCQQSTDRSNQRRRSRCRPCLAPRAGTCTLATAGITISSEREAKVGDGGHPAAGGDHQVLRLLGALRAKAASRHASCRRAPSWGRGTCACLPSGAVLAQTSNCTVVDGGAIFLSARPCKAGHHLFVPHLPLLPGGHGVCACAGCLSLCHSGGRRRRRCHLALALLPPVRVRQRSALPGPLPPLACCPTLGMPISCRRRPPLRCCLQVEESASTGWFFFRPFKIDVSAALCSAIDGSPRLDQRTHHRHVSHSSIRRPRCPPARRRPAAPHTLYPAASAQVWIAILVTVFTIPVVTFVTEFLSIEASCGGGAL